MNAHLEDSDRTESFVPISDGSSISHYRVVRQIGIGGMGEVYLAEDTKLNRQVAMKFLTHRLASDEKARSRFSREAQATAAISHPNVVTIHEVGEHKGRPFIVMEYLKGESLRDVIKRGNVSVGKAVDIALQVSEGLQHAHNTGVIHRDIKPGNIMIDKNGRCTILDFGLAAVTGDDRLTVSGATLGTVGYMSPEQVRGEKADRSSDIFSFGVLIYELITCRQPFFRDGPAATMNAILTDEPEPMARFKRDVPVDLQRVVDKALEKRQDLRYRHTDEVLTDLLRVKRTSLSDSDMSSFGRISPGEWRWKNVVKNLVVSLLSILILLMLIPSTRDGLRKTLGLSHMPESKHLAVLPFVNLGEGEANQAFCDGLMETMTSRLTQMEMLDGSLWVVPASQVRRENVTSPNEARQAFGAELVVTGSVQRFESLVRIGVNLVDTKRKRQIGSTVIDYNLADVSLLQDSTVMRLAELLEISGTEEEQRHAVEGGTTSPEAYEAYVLGNGYRLQREFDLAIDAFTLAIEKDPEYALAFSGLGEAYWQKYVTSGEPEYEVLATSNGKRAIQLNDRLAEAFITLGVIHRESGRYDEAVNILERGLERDSANHKVRRELAKTYVDQNNPVLAESAYVELLDLKSDYWDGYLDLAFFYIRQGRTDDAIKQLRNLERLDPRGFVALNNLGGLYYFLGQDDDAQRQWEKSHAVRPNYGACSNLGTLHYYSGRYREAAIAYENALRLDDSDHLVWGNLGAAYAQIPGKREQCHEAYRQAIERAVKLSELDPQNATVLMDLAEYHAALDDCAHAIPYAEQSLSLQPDNTEILVSAALVYEQAGNRETALKWTKRALELGYELSDIEDIPELSPVLSQLQNNTEPPDSANSIE